MKSFESALDIEDAQLERGPQVNPDIPSKVMVAYGEYEKGAVMWAVGHHISMEMDDSGLTDPEDLGLEPDEPGIWVWEGIYVYVPGYVDGYEAPGEGYMEPKGTWRLPTDQEWEALRNGECPWDPKEWLKTHEELEKETP